MNLFFITVLHTSAHRTRCWGFYSTFEEAEKAVLSNSGDIYEMGYYDLAVIEKMEEGISPIAVPEENKWYWADHNSKDDTYTVSPITCPTRFERTCNFAIG